MSRNRDYNETLEEMLANPRQAAAYLNAALQDEDSGVFLLALRDVADVHGGIGRLAELSGLNRESMYRMLSEAGNPRISSLNAVLNTLGLKLSVMPTRSKRSVA